MRPSAIETAPLFQGSRQLRSRTDFADPNIGRRGCATARKAAPSFLPPRRQAVWRGRRAALDAVYAGDIVKVQERRTRDQRQMGERLREIAKVLVRSRIDFFGIETDIVGIAEQTIEQFARFGDAVRTSRASTSQKLVTRKAPSPPRTPSSFR